MFPVLTMRIVTFFRTQQTPLGRFLRYVELPPHIPQPGMSPGVEREGVMQQDEQEEQEHKCLPQTSEQSVQETETNSAATPELSAERQKAEEYLDLLRRTQADFVNYRRRMSQEQAEGRIAAQSALLSHLLPVLDDLGRALGAAPPELATHPWGL